MNQIIKRLAWKCQIYTGNALSKYGLTAAEQPFLRALQRHEGVTQEELTTLVQVDKAATARAVKSLESKGLLSRVQDEQDRRQNRIYLTDAARELKDAVRSELRRFNDLLTAGIDSESLEMTYAVLLKMQENLNDIHSERSAETGKGGQRNETT